MIPDSVIETCFFQARSIFGREPIYQLTMNREPEGHQRAAAGRGAAARRGLLPRPGTPHELNTLQRTARTTAETANRMN